MWRFTRFNNRLNTLKVGLLGTVGLMILYSCSDSTAPARPTLSANGIGLVANVVFPGYTAETVPFKPEPSPTINAASSCQDCFVDKGLPIGFSFTFFGNVYDKINISSKGLVGFGPLDAAGLPVFQRDGCCTSGFIPKNDVTNNIIALGWGDWTPNSVKQIRHETRGAAPNRIFVVEYINVGENGGNGHLSAQLVLYEHSNDIVIYTKEINTTLARRTFTQGIENLAGNEAKYVAGRDSAKFSLTNDAVKFSLVATNVAPYINVPADLSANTGAASCVASVSVGMATATDDAPGVTISYVRSDDATALDAPFKKGVTTINWTAKDAEGLLSSAVQTVTVSDKEIPVVTAPPNKVVRTAKGLSTAWVDVGTATASDNCGNVTVKGVRSVGSFLESGYSLGVTTITWTATDESGNVATAIQTVTVTPNQPPVFTFVPVAVAVNTELGKCSAHAELGVALAKDDLDEGLVVTAKRGDNLPLSEPYRQGTTIVTWTATDADQASTLATQEVKVSDNQKPSITAPANMSVPNNPGVNSAMVSQLGSPVVNDNCSPENVMVSASRNDELSLGSPYPIGSTIITWKATDAALNFSTATQTIVVRDTTAPVLGALSNLVANATSPSGAVVSFSVNATDNIGVTSIECSAASGSVFPIAVTTVACTAYDAAGNHASGTFTVTVLSARQQLQNLIAYTSGLGLPNGTAQPLLNQLEAALRALDGNAHIACNKLADFMSLASAKSNKPDGVSTQARPQTTIVGDAQRICDVLGCG